MHFDISTLETATVVFIGTLAFSLAIVVFILTAAFITLIVVGAGLLVWEVLSAAVIRLVHGINHSWDRLARHASAVELPGDFQERPPLIPARALPMSGDAG